jgi:hypothetical protein
MIYAAGGWTLLASGLWFHWKCSVINTLVIIRINYLIQWGMADDCIFIHASKLFQLMSSLSVQRSWSHWFQFNFVQNNNIEFHQLEIYSISGIYYTWQPMSNQDHQWYWFKNSQLSWKFTTVHILTLFTLKLTLFVHISSKTVLIHPVFFVKYEDMYMHKCSYKRINSWFWFDLILTLFADLILSMFPAKHSYLSYLSYLYK